MGLCQREPHDLASQEAQEGWGTEQHGQLLVAMQPVGTSEALEKSQRHRETKTYLAKLIKSPSR